MATNTQARLPATAEFDSKLAKMYDKALTEVQRHLRKSVSTINIDLTKILFPTNAKDDQKVARKFTKKRLRILESLDQLIRSMSVGRNTFSMADMFGKNAAMSKRYARRYDKIKMNALNRLETGVSLMKFKKDTDVPLATILFPTRNTNLYTIRYELLKQQLLTKLSKGIRNLEFTAPKKGGFFSKIEKSRAQVPIDNFLIPTANTNSFAARMNWSKHVLLSKVHKGIKNLEFTAPSKDRSFRLTKIEKTRAEVPIDSFLIPSGNTWFYAAKYELAKLKLLKKVRQGINKVKFTGGNYDILEKFMPDDVSGSEVAKVVSKAISRSINRESKAKAKSTTRSAKANEFAIHKTQKREDKRLALDEERNKILKEALFGKGTSKAMSKPVEMRQGRDGTWAPKGGMLSGAASTALSLGKKAAPVVAVAGAGLAGYGAGKLIDKKLDISGNVGNAAGAITEAKGNRKFVKDIVKPGLSRNAEVKKIYDKLTGGKKQSKNEQAKIYEQAVHLYRMRQASQARRAKAAQDAMPNQVLKNVKVPPMQMSTASFQPTSAANFYSDTNVNQNAAPMAQFEALLNETQKTNALLKNVQGTKIINPRPNPDFNLSQNLDSYLTR